MGSNPKGQSKGPFLSIFLLTLSACFVSSIVLLTQQRDEQHAERLKHEASSVRLASDGFTSRLERYKTALSSTTATYAKVATGEAREKRRLLEKQQERFPRIDVALITGPEGNFYFWGSEKLEALPASIEAVQKGTLNKNEQPFIFEDDPDHVWLFEEDGERDVFVAFDEREFLAWSRGLDFHQFQPEAGLSIEGNWFASKSEEATFDWALSLWALLFSLVLSLCTSLMATFMPWYRRLLTNDTTTEETTQRKAA